MHDPFETLQAELARQDEFLSSFEETLRSFGDDVELAIPQTFLDELAELTEPRVINSNPTMPFLGIRG